MNLVVVTALIAVCGAAKLDRTYLPPASAKTAGGSPGSLQTPFARNSLNNGLGGLPKGSYENDFQGVVVDAAAAGTRASEPGESGLGAPRISYGSTNSKVGGAAFKTRPSAFAPAQSDQQTEQGFEAQGTFPSGAVSSGFQQGSSFSNAEAPNSAFQQQSAANSDRPRASLDSSASILRYENEVGPESYHYAFETDNGISAEENGVATNGVQAQGGFSYTGDDGQVYSVSYTADERGYQPKGDHLPTPPPIPEEILKSLEQNARDEAAGLSDDGSYDAQRYNAGSDYAESENANGKFTHQSSKFGADTDAATFNQNQGSRRPVTGQSSFNSQAGQGSNLNGQNANRYSQVNFASGTNGASNGQGFNAQSGQTSTGPSEQLELADDDSTSGQFGQASTGVPSQTNGFGSFSGTSSQSGSKQSLSQSGLGNRNEYLPPTNRPNGRPQNSRQPNGRPQNGRPQAGRPQELESADASQANQQQSDEETPVPLGQQDLQDESRPQQAVTSFGKPISNGITAQNGFGSSNNQFRPSSGRRPSSNNNNFVQGQLSQTGRPNEYLPPTVSSPNRKPLTRPQSANTFASQFTQQNQESPEDSEDVQSQDQTQDFPGSASIGSQSTFGSQPIRFQKPQPSRQGQKNNRLTSQSQTTSNSVSAQSSFGFNSQKATAPPATELTTPFESSNNDAPLQSNSQTTVDDFTLPSSQQSNGLSAQASFVNQQSNGQNSFGSQSVSRPLASRPQKPRPFGQSQASAYPTQSSIGQFNKNGQFINQPQSQSSFDQSEDAQYSSSTQRPSFTGQPQGADDSYYYNQPSKPFGTPQGSRFPSAPSNQFNRVTQQSTFEQSQFSNEADNVPSTAFPSSQFQGSTKYPRPPVIRPTAPTSQIQGQFGNNYRKPGSTKQPRPPTLAPPTFPTGPSQSQYQSGNVNGVTQAAISPFPSQTPTQAPQGQFGSRPTFQQSQYNQGSQSATSSFSQESTMPSFTQQSIASASFSRRPSASDSFPSSAPMFGQQTESQGNDENEQPVPSQQYTGEIYEYSKPAVTLPPPDSTPASPSPQFGNKMPGQGQFGKPQAQFGQTSEEEDHMTVAQFGSQSQAQGSRPQFTQSKPQFGQTFGAHAQQNEPDMKPFGALAQSQAMFGSQASKPSRPQFGQSRPQFGQTQNAFGQSESTQELEDEKPQFGSQPETESEAGPDESQSPEGPKNQFGFVSACCKDNASRKPAKNQFGVQSQGAQSSFAGAQKQPNSFAGKGEEFGGPRQPPSFDEETGYHY